MASKKVIVNIKVTQDGAKVSDVTKDVKKLTEAEKERIKVKNDLKKTEAKIEIVNEENTKSLKEKKSILKDLANQQLTSSQIAKIAAKKEAEDTREQINLEKKALAEKKRTASNSASIDAQRSRALISQFNAQEKLTQKTIESAQAQELLNKNLQQFKTTSGLSGAIVTEFGRTVSDLPFGIRGVGNNLAQLGSLFGSLAVNAKKAGGSIKDAIGQILVSFKGIVGFITVFQVFVALLQTDFFQKWAKGLLKTTGLLKIFSSELSRLKNEIAGVSQEFGTLANELDVYTGILKDSARGIREKEAAYDKLIKRFPEMESSIKRVGDEFIISSKAVDTMRSSLEQYALSASAMNRLNEIYEEGLKDQLEAMVDLNQSFKDSNKLKKEGFQNVSKEDMANIKEYAKTIKNDKDDKGFVITQKQRVEAVKKLEEIYEKSRETERVRLISSTGESRGYVRNTKNLNNYVESLKKVSEEQEDLIKVKEDFNKTNGDEIEALKELIKVKKEDKKIEGRTPRTPREKLVKQFKESLFSMQREQEKADQDLRNTKARTNEEILIQEGESSKKAITIKRDEFKEKEKLRLDDFIKQQELNKLREGITQAEKDKITKAISDAKALSKKTIESAEKESQEVISSISNVTQARIDNKAKLDALNQGRLDDSVEEGSVSIGVDRMIDGEEKVRAEDALAQLRYDNKLFRANQELELQTTTENRRREIEAQKAIWQQERDDEELQRELDIIEQKKISQQEYISFVSGAAGILQSIGKKNKEFQKAQLLLEKGAAVANVIVKTAAANQAILVASTARAAAGDASAVKLGASRIAKNKIGAGISIATILSGAASGLSAISNSGDSGSSESSAGDSPQQAPDFNIIGSTGVNQLADAIGGTTGQSVRAFVVSSDITNQQALDRSINESAQI